MLVNTTVGESVTFQCTAESFGRPEALQYYWLEIVNNTAIPIVDATTNTLQFIAVAKDDSTLYQCAATNENATVFSNTGRLNGKYIHYTLYKCYTGLFTLLQCVFIWCVCETVYVCVCTYVCACTHIRSRIICVVLC